MKPLPVLHKLRLVSRVRSRAFTAIESLVVLVIVFIFTMILIALVKRNSDESINTIPAAAPAEPSGASEAPQRAGAP